MLGQREDSMSYGNAKCAPSPVMSDRKQSECQEAYHRLIESQEQLSDAVSELHSRLGLVLGNQNGPDGAVPTREVVSELHGWLISAEERTYAVMCRVRAITESLTI